MEVCRQQGAPFSTISELETLDRLLYEFWASTQSMMQCEQQIHDIPHLAHVAVEAQKLYAKPDHTCEEQQAVEKLVGAITAEHVGLTANPDVVNKLPAGNFYMEVFEDDFLSIGVFILDKGESIPLHNHPDMTVMCKLLFGRVQVKSYTVIDGKKVGVPGEVLRCRKTEDCQASNKMETHVVESERSNNIHEIVALERTAFIDVAGPPYNDEDRVCSYFKRIPCPARTAERRAITTREDHIELMEVMREEDVTYALDPLAYCGPSLQPYIRQMRVGQH